jgi:membrane protein implicated in regulation of membrane protease activity
MCHHEVPAMRKFVANMATAKQILWECVELGFVAILAIMLVYLILGQGSGAFVTSVADNVTKFASGVPTQSLIGLALVLAVIYLITNRLNRTRESRPSSRQSKESSQ